MNAVKVSLMRLPEICVASADKTFSVDKFERAWSSK